MPVCLPVAICGFISVVEVDVDGHLLTLELGWYFSVLDHNFSDMLVLGEFLGVSVPMYSLQNDAMAKVMTLVEIKIALGDHTNSDVKRQIVSGLIHLVKKEV